MEELAKALAEAIKTGAAAAGPAIHSYFTYQIWTYVISYGFPCLTILTIAGMVAFLLNKVINKIAEGEELKDGLRHVQCDLGQLRAEVRSKAKS